MIKHWSWERENMLTSKKCPLVSVYVLMYKSIEGLSKTLDSIIKQDYPRIELIISEDGSGKIKEEDILAYIEPYKKYFEKIVININNTNVGTIRHLNIVIKKSSGDILCGISPEDVYYDKNVIKNVVTYFLNNPQKVIVTSKRLDETDNLIRPTKKLQNILVNHFEKYKKIMLRATPLISGAGTFYRREIFDKYGYFPEEFKLVEDASYYTKLVDKGVEFGFLDCITYVHAAGGVSDKSTTPHPWWVQDREYLYETWLMEIAKKEDWFSERCVKFHIQRVLKEKTFALIFLCLKYIDVCFYLLWFYKEEIIEILLKHTKRKS